MLQFYFLSILLNAVTGFILFFVTIGEHDSDLEDNIPSFFHDTTFTLVLGLLTVIVGFFKILSTIHGDVAVVGDLLPALAGLSGGVILLFDFYKTRADFSDGSIPVFLKTIIDSRKYVGLACLISAALHLLFPTVLFL